MTELSCLSIVLRALLNEGFCLYSNYLMLIKKAMYVQRRLGIDNL